MIHVLGMRYEHPKQLKITLANYGVSNGYQLWFMRNNWRSLLVCCGRSVEVGRCIGKYIDKKKKVQKKLFADFDTKSPRPAKFAKTAASTSNSAKYAKSAKSAKKGKKKLPKKSVKKKSAAASTMEQILYANMDEIKFFNLEAYEYLILRNPNTWCRAFFNLDVKCAAFENGILKSYHRAILLQRSEPIITMLEDIRIYIIQRWDCDLDSLGSNCQSVGHNKATRGGGRGTMGGGRGPKSGDRCQESGGRGHESGGKGKRGGGSTSGFLMDEKDIMQSMEDEYLEGQLDEQEEQRQKEEKEHQEKLDEEAFQQVMEEQRMYERMGLERER
ncbi:hypothetical protein Tco_0680985 [Tanacetum coccineum]|uniref:Uncharacterized protein n=1 Tax=Tanacetum coccineum TaxID=301880 RepID=A0ABQ4XNI6_9ASTR